MRTEVLRAIFLSALATISVLAPISYSQISSLNSSLNIRSSSSGLISHDPIFIDSNAGFTPANGVVGGSGRENDPYIIENWDISAENVHGIWIRNTTAYFVIRNCYVHGIELGSVPIPPDGIRLENVRNGNIGNVRIENYFRGLHLISSYNNLLLNNTIFRNWDGIRLGSSSNNILRNNTCSNIWHYGIFLDWSSNNTLENNNLYSNCFGTEVNGISRNNVIKNNTFSNNFEYGIRLWSSYNFIYHNNFFNNTAYDGGKNYWDNGYPSGGNYWSDYTGADYYHGENQDLPRGDWIGDTYYDFPYGRDRYPLMKPWPFIGGVVEINKPQDGFEASGSIEITFDIINTGDSVEFKQGARDRVDLEIEFVENRTDIMYWSTSYYGLTLAAGRGFTKTVIYDIEPRKWYGNIIIRIVHWKYMDNSYRIGEFGKHEISGKLTPVVRKAELSISPSYQSGSPERFSTIIFS